MERDADVVIGGRAVGLWAAYFLRRSGREVVVLDRGDVGAACSFGNAGFRWTADRRQGTVTLNLAGLLSPLT